MDLRHLMAWEYLCCTSLSAEPLGFKKAPTYWAASVGSTSVVDGGILPRTGEQHAQRHG